MKSTRYRPVVILYSWMINSCPRQALLYALPPLLGLPPAPHDEEDEDDEDPPPEPDTQAGPPPGHPEAETEARPPFEPPGGLYMRIFSRQVEIIEYS